MPTLRSWEQRYGVPAPRRTESSYRLYSDADIALVERMLRLCESGLSAAEAAEEVLKRTSQRSKAVPASNARAAIKRIMKAVRRFEPESLDAELRAVLKQGAPADVYDTVFRPAMALIGTDWATGNIGIAHEHMASFAVESLLAAALRDAQPVGNASRVLLACLEGELHCFGLYGVALRLAGWGVRSIPLGRNVSVPTLCEAVAAYKPDAVGLSITMPMAPATLKRLLEAVSNWGNLPWLVGGAATQGAASKIIEAGGTPIIGADHCRLSHFLQMNGLIRAPNSPSSKKWPGTDVRS